MRMIIAALSLLLFISPALSEPPISGSVYKAPGHDKYHHWYQMIQKQLGISGCCDRLNNDCGPATAYRFTPSGLEVLLKDGGDTWYLFSGTIHYVDETPDSKAHVCRKPVPGGSGFSFYCAFIPRGSV